MAHYLVARIGGQLVAYGGMWLMVDEGPHHDLRRAPRLAPPAAGGAAAARVPGPRRGPPGARSHPQGPPVQHRRSTAVREVRLPPRRSASALLQRRPRGRPDHDHRAARRPRDAGTGRAAASGARCVAGAAPHPNCRRARAVPVRPTPMPRPRRTDERPAGPRHRVVVRRDGHRPGRGRSTHPEQRRRLAGRAARPVRWDRARSRRPGPSALDRARARRGHGRHRRDLGRHRRRDRDLRARAWPVLCWSASTSPRPWPGSTTSRW